MASFSQSTTEALPDAGPDYGSALLRLAVALGDPERERILLPYLSQREEITVSVRCLAAEQLIAAAREGRADVAVVASDLHRLAPAGLTDLRRMLRLVVLAPEPDAPRWEDVADAVLPVTIEPEVLAVAILALARGELAQTPRLAASQAERYSRDDREAPVGTSSFV